MPLYEYICEICGNNVEVKQPVHSNPIECGKCKTPMKRKIFAPAVHYGAGFFHHQDWGKTDNARVFYPDGRSVDKTYNERHGS